MSNGRWEYCISHKNDEVNKFIDIYFSQSDKKVLLIGGAGFDLEHVYSQKCCMKY